MVKKCSVCGNDISEARLEALPDTTMCVVCASKKDQPMRTATLKPDPDAPHPRGW
jgi:RNA polymerase-binding transcription factor DksA